MVVLTREDDYHDRYRQPDKLKITGGRELDWPAPYWYVDAGAAIMALMLAAVDEGLESAIFGVPTCTRSVRRSGSPTTSASSPS